MTGGAAAPAPGADAPRKLADAVPHRGRIAVGHSAGEPIPLVEMLSSEAAEIAPERTFVGLGLAESIAAESSAVLRLTALGGAGSTGRFFRAGRLAVLLSHYSEVPRLIRSGRLAFDVALLQLSPVEGGAYNLGVMGDYLATVAATAPRIIAEVNDRMPRTFGDTDVPEERVDAFLHTSRPLLEQPPARIGDLEREIARRVAAMVPDGATIQIGLGAIADAVLRGLRDKRDLGVHTGVIGDAIVDLVEAGVVTGRRKERDEGLVVTGSLLGTQRVYRWADRNPNLRVRGADYTHSAAVLADLEALISINSAVEVDLTGQTNAEVIGSNHIGLIGGHADFVRAGAASPGGRSIVALPSTAAGGRRSRIVAKLESGVVTTSRADIDTVVTEYGAAELRGRTIEERARSLIAIAHPDFRAELTLALDRLV